MRDKLKIYTWLGKQIMRYLMYLSGLPPNAKIDIKLQLAESILFYEK